MVHSRNKAGQAEEFGVSGYVHKNVFLIFDRKTESLWYPFDGKAWTAISGPRAGEKLPIIEEPAVIPLGKWRKKHPNTKVLLGSAKQLAESAGH